MSTLTLARLFAIAGSIVALAELAYFSDGYLPRQLLPIALWAGAMMPLAYWVGKRLVKGPRAAAVLTAGAGLRWRSACSASGCPFAWFRPRGKPRRAHRDRRRRPISLPCSP